MTTLLGLRSPERRRESACSVDRVSTVSEANTAGTGSSAARARRPPPPEAPLERRARTSLLSSEDIKAFVESRGKHRGFSVADIVRGSHAVKLGLRGSRSGPRGPDFPRKLSGPVRSKTPSCVRETGEDSARIAHLLRRWRVIVRVTIWCRRHILHHNLRHKLYDEISPYLSKLHFHDEDLPSDLLFDPTHFKADRQLRISEETKRVLSKPPGDRTDSELHYAQVSLRNLRSFAEFPMRMQSRVARVGRYERHEAKRVLVRQGHPAEAFYFILSGSVVVMVTDQETKVAKPVAYLYKGMTFGELAIAHRQNRQSTVIAKEATELMSVDAASYEVIFMSRGKVSLFDPDHQEFIRSLEYLHGWPLEKMDTDPDKCFFHYYKRDEVLVQDTSHSNWLIIIKSGSIKVLKKLKRVRPSVPSLRRRNSGPDVLTGSERRDFRSRLRRERRDVLPELRLPLRPLSEVGVDYRPITPRPRPRAITMATQLQPRGIGRKSGSSAPKEINTQRKARPPNIVITAESLISEAKSPRTPTKNQLSNGNKTLPLRTISKQEQKREEEDQEMEGREQHIRTLTRDLDTSSAQTKSSRELTEADRDPQFIEVQNLIKGHVFGLCDLLLGARSGFSLVSAGAECVMLHKNHFLQHAPGSLINRLKQELSPYPSSDALQAALQTQVDWNGYSTRVLEEFYRSRNIPLQRCQVPG